MSSGTQGSNGTVITTGPKIIQTADFYVSASVLHPIVIGSIAVVSLFAFLRVVSNRSVAPITIFDWLITVALGSTLAGIVNGNSLVRGLLGLITMLSFQYITSFIGSHSQGRFTWILTSPPLVIVFRGELLTGVMKSHRIAHSDLNGALRQQGIVNISQVECAIIEPTGKFSVFTKKQLREFDGEPTVLLDIPAYAALCEDAEQRNHRNSANGDDDAKSGSTRDRASTCDDAQNRVAGDAC